MKKLWKILAALAVAGTAVGLVLAYFFKKDSGENSLEEDMETTNDDLDNDLKPITDREYVPLNKTAREQSPEVSEEDPSAAASEDASLDSKEAIDNESGRAEAQSPAKEEDKEDKSEEPKDEESKEPSES